MSKLIKFAAPLALLLASTHTYAAYRLPGHFLIEGGGYYSTSGQNEDVFITGLIGDRFTVTNHNDTNTIFGFGYLFDGYQNGRFGIDYGINVFYLAKTKVSGTITQEFLFTNLAYKYYVSHLPVYLFAKAYVKTNCEKLAVTFDAGIGPNFMSTNLYADSSLDGETLPDNAYMGNFSSTTFSGMVGVGIKYNVMNQVPVELGYRYFYLGEGYFNPRTSQILTQLKTGTNTAQALILTVSV